MPIGPFERVVLKLLAAQRSASSFVAGGSVINQAPDSPRYSRDVDIFHDQADALEDFVERDSRALRSSGFTVEIEPKPPTLFQAIVSRDSQLTKLEWVVDSPFRFFPPEPDSDLGWRLNFWDAATNKLLALAGRQEARDLLDVLFLHRHHLHLGALAWAAAGKDPGFTPEAIIAWSRRHAQVHPEDLERLQLEAPLDLISIKEQWLEAADAAETLISTLPPTEVGCLFLDPSTLRPENPNPDSPAFPALVRHYGTTGGTYPQLRPMA